jgi:predicted esterase
LWSGIFPPDLEPGFNKKFSGKKVSLLIGDNDEFISKDEILQHEKELKDAGLEYRLTVYGGKHDIDAETLKSLVR